ncbi:MAG TPA: phosphoenolpyruvate synthase [Candidatus Pacearchaeota archaeon]|nr:phosphoenolpyruvate synthase [Candidatus Pacearchaeota archaeon]
MTKEVSQKIDYIKWFSELNKDSGKVAGGKGANLAEIYNLKIQVPPGFVVTAQAYDYFLKNAGLNEKITSLLNSIKYEDTEQLTKTTTQIRELIENADFPEEMKKEILEAYEDLGTNDSQIKDMSAHKILKKSAEPGFVAVRSSATTEDLAEASFAGQQDTFLNVKGDELLLIHIKKAFSSLFTPRATYYRNKQGFKHEQASLAVVVQKMIDSDKSGVIFSKDPATKRDHIVMEAVWGLGEGIVSGRITPDRYIISKESGEFKISEIKVLNKKIAIIRGSSGSKQVVKLKEDVANRQVLKEYEIKKLSEIALKLEEHYKKPQDIEFAIDGEGIYIVQTRPITTMEKRVEAGSGRELKGEVILTGLAASPGIGVGKIKIIQTMKDLKKIVTGDILVTKMTNPDMVVTMQKATAIVTDEGGLTAHAAIVSREMGIPAVVGTQTATTKLKEGEIITVNGFTGKIYKGKVAETEKKEVLPVSVQTKTKIKVILDLPSFAGRAAKTKLDGVGLARVEGIIAESGKHPRYFLENKNIQEYEEIIFKGINEIASYFQEIWVRTSDIRSDEFKNLEGSPKEIEANPMLGMHGIRYSLKYPEILKAELNAMKKVSEKGKKIGILTPQVISVEEIKKLKEVLKEVQFTDAKVGVMIETPASVQIIKDLCKEGIDFISFGTNDLTQYTLAVDRGNREVQNIYNELDPSILYQLEHVLNTCKESNVETSICGQAGSKKEMVKFLVERGINSISVNADVASEIANYVLELEGGTPPANADQKPGENFVKPQNVPQEKEEIQKPVETPSPQPPIQPQTTPTEQSLPEPEEEIPKIRGSEYIEKEIKEPEEEKQTETNSQETTPQHTELKPEPTTEEDIKQEVPEEIIEEPETPKEIVKDIEESGVPEEVAKEEEKLDELEEKETPTETEKPTETQTENREETQPQEKESKSKEEVLDIF